MLAGFARFVDRLNTLIASGVRWLALLMVLATVAIVILRYFFNVGAIALQESVMYMHGLLFMSAIGYGLKQDTHVRVDLVYSRLGPRPRQWIDLAGHAIFLLPVAAFVFFASFPYVAASWRVAEGSSEVGGIPAIFVLKTLLPIMALLLALQGLSQSCKIVLALRRDPH